MRDLKEIFNEITQVGIVVDDIERVRKTMKQLFDADPIASRAGLKQYTNASYHGEAADFQCQILHYDFASIELEFIQPAGGKSVWQDHLDAHGNSIHHVMFNVEHCDEAKEGLALKGIYPVQEGDVPGTTGQYWSYYDLTELGFSMEVISGRSLRQKNS